MFAATACTEADAPAPVLPLPAPSESLSPYPIDAGVVNGAPASYKGLPLQLVMRPSPAITPVDGVIGVVCVGMSNANQECSRLMAGTAPGGPWAAEVSASVRLVNCAVGNHAIERWIDPAFDATLWQDCLDRKLAARGVRRDQVRVILHKAANQFGMMPDGSPRPMYPAADANFHRFRGHLDTFASRVRTFFPAVQAVYTSSRSFGGFTARSDRGEPQSYEEGHALNGWLADHATVEGVWHGWWGYLWAPSCGGGVVNASGVCFDRSDYQPDAVHPTASGEIKIARIQHERLRRESWYAR
jgi:hypothetical protein